MRTVVELLIPMPTAPRIIRASENVVTGTNWRWRVYRLEDWPFLGDGHLEKT